MRMMMLRSIWEMELEWWLWSQRRFMSMCLYLGRHRGERSM